MDAYVHGWRARMKGEPRIEWSSIAIKSRASWALLFRCPNDRNPSGELLWRPKTPPSRDADLRPLLRMLSVVRVSSFD